ncbi:protein-methionine-sulfoxide reductase heme-binding subunit MsrQ [Endozoicomonas euniceicola]|uniref:Protein-methionine-sulfoxide reductase heme-binding subunit MsrQ n=1 Tax=Endozoicomonas euniceicola TaxID=1234143 RepID=A0ABY6H0K5_9GAMM|nr:protein-methionine-sulfoxide reductase heme-binding subunit MsrQ [Endozoicomonas euniceicola]UYM17816.1 sulfoxide reductase heme-binding subunit YedZ [Endozoicomonas euniceicola]
MSHQLGPDPGSELTRGLGEWALRFLCLTLLVTPLRKMTGLTKLIRFRRMLGLFTLFYALLHTLSYLAFMLGWQWLTLLEDLYKRPYIIAGALAGFVLVVLGITSTKGMMRRLGRNWSKLHRLIYVSAVLAVIHYLWLVKSDYSEPVFYLVVVVFLLCFRVPFNRLRFCNSGTKK